MKLAIFGASGKTGAQLMTQALAAGDTVVALARDPATISTRHDRLSVIQGDATNADDVTRAIAGTAAVFSGLGPRGRQATTLRADAARNIVAAMQQHGVTKVVWLSASGVGDSLDQAKRSSFVFGRLLIPLLLKATYVDAKNAEDILAGAGLAHVLARPPGLTNKPLRGDVIEVPLDQKLSRLTIPRADVAAWMLARARDDRFDRQAVTIC